MKIRNFDDFKQAYAEIRKVAKSPNDFKNSGYVLADDFDPKLFFNNLLDEEDCWYFFKGVMERFYNGKNAQQKADFANKVLDAVRKYYKGSFRQGLAFTLFQNIERYIFLRNEKVYRKWSRKLTPDNQVLCALWGRDGTEFDFQNIPFTDFDLVKEYLKMCPYDKQVEEKLSIDMGGKRILGAKTLFPKAKNPELLMEIRQKKEHILVALRKMPREDFVYIIPMYDFKNLDVSEVWDIMSSKNFSWTAEQVRAMMSLMIDLAPKKPEYLKQILQIFEANTTLFSKKNKENAEIFKKLSYKFDDLIEKEIKSWGALLNDDVRRRDEVGQSAENLMGSVKQLYCLQDERKEWSELKRQVEDVFEKIKTYREYYDEQKKIIQRALGALKAGKKVDIPTPKKPWVIFSSPEEKVDFGEINFIIGKIKAAEEERDKNRMRCFGEIEFDIDYRLSQLEKEVDEYNYYRRSKAEIEKSVRSAENELGRFTGLREEIVEQSEVRKSKIAAAREELLRKGKVLGVKSPVTKIGTGVVRD